MPKYTILFDTETTGLLKPDAVDLDQQPYIIELFATKIDEEFNHIADFHSLFKPPIEVPTAATRVNQITPEMLEDAEPFSEVYEEMADFFLGTERLVAHNIGFDRGMLANELSRIEKLMKFPWPMEHICTVEKSMYIQQRRMSLDNLHRYLFGKGITGAHRARNDVYALVRCYHELMEIGRIDP